MKKAGSESAKTINAIEKDNLLSFFNILEHVYDVALSQVSSEVSPKNMGNPTD